MQHSLKIGAGELHPYAAPWTEVQVGLAKYRHRPLNVDHQVTTAIGKTEMSLIRLTAANRSWRGWRGWWLLRECVQFEIPL
jgi:hypothetical protein